MRLDNVEEGSPNKEKYIMKKKKEVAMNLKGNEGRGDEVL